MTSAQVIEEFDLEDADLTVEALRIAANTVGCAYRDCPVCETTEDGHRAAQMRLIANHLALTAAQTRARTKELA